MQMVRIRRLIRFGSATACRLRTTTLLAKDSIPTILASAFTTNQRPQMHRVRQPWQSPRQNLEGG
jgi:hypothetical protein